LYYRFPGGRAVRCSNVKKRLSEYLDSRLNTKDRIAVENHLQECISCRNLHRDMHSLCNDLRSLPDPPVPAALASRINRIPVEFEQRMAFRPSYKLGWVAAAVAAMIVVLVLEPTIMRHGETDESVAEINPAADTQGDMVEVRRLLLPEERPATTPVQWVRLPMSRGVPLDRRSQPVEGSMTQRERDEQIWEEVRRVSAASRRSF